MSEDRQSTGVVASVVLHGGLLAFLLIGLASAPRFEDASESIPVDTVSKDQFESVMKGEPNAKPAPQAAPSPPMPPQPPPDLRKAEETPPPPPVQPPPPPRPEPTMAAQPPVPPVRPEPPPPVKPPPSPPPRPEPPPKPDAMETPPPRPKPVETPPERPKPDQFAKLIQKDKSDDTAKSSAKPYDAKAIAKLIGEGKPSAAPAAPAPNAGLPTAHAARMSGSQERALDEWFKDAYMACWSPPPTMPEGETYIPEVSVEFNADGSLSGHPVLVNPPADPAWRAHAESAMRAALRCNPLKVPPQYAPFFDQWRSKTIHFDPREALG